VAVLGCGPIGCFAIGVVKACGALKIYASDVSDMRLEIAKKMGATVTYNADKVDVTAEILKETNGCGVDVVLDVSGAPGAIKTGVNVVRKAGRFTFVGIPDQQSSSTRRLRSRGSPAASCGRPGIRLPICSLPACSRWIR
jgi:threonine 3-dehydrogenase